MSQTQTVLHNRTWRNDYAYALARCDAVITDPPYDIAAGDLLPLMECKGNIIMFCAPENQYFYPDEYLFWIKTPSTKNYTKHPGRFVEMMLVKRGPTFNMLHWSQMTGVYDDRLIKKPEHPYEKPLSLIERLIRIYTNPGDWVYDPFMGSGTTAVACKRLGRNFVGNETEKDYFNLVQKRIETGE